MNKKIIFKDLDNLDKESVELLIDTLIDYYADKYGIELDTENLVKPEIPTYDCENTDIAKLYLQKFRLKGIT